MKTRRLKFFLAILFAYTLVQAQPYQYKGSEFIRIVFLTNQDVLNRIVPEPLKANSQGLIVLDVGLQKMELGLTYHEMVLSIPVEFNGKTGAYSALLYLNNVMAITGGREIWGFPKYDAEITFQKDNDHITAQINKNNKLLIEADVTLGNTVENYKADDPLLFVQKIIPSVEEGSIDVKKINSVYLRNCTYNKYREAEAKLIMNSIPDSSIGEIPVLKILSASYFVFDFVLGFGKVEYDYLKQKQ
jgi:acetoacetate decarboxylase